MDHSSDNPATTEHDRKKVVIAGSSGLIGSALVAALRAANYRIVRLVRRVTTSGDEQYWNPDSGTCDPTIFDGAQAVINLCGVGVGDKRWSGAVKQSLRDSRIAPTEVISAAAANTGVPVLINASAVGYYGATEDRIIDESFSAGTGFLAQLCADWEAAAQPAADAGVRVVLARTGLVLSPHGGMLARLRPLFTLGLGAQLGNGRHYMPWISLADEVRALIFAITHAELAGPVNLTGPAPVTNSEFTAALGQQLHRPTPWVIPGCVLRAALGEFATEGLLSGQRAIPVALEHAGFTFSHSTIEQALTYALKANTASPPASAPPTT